jgi:hypothetical protein
VLEVLALALALALWRSLRSFFYAGDRAIESAARENQTELDRLPSVCYGGHGFKNWLARTLYHRLLVMGYHGLKAVYRLVRTHGGGNWAG